MRTQTSLIARPRNLHNGIACAIAAILVLLVSPGSRAASFELVPFAPKSGDAVTVSITEVCASLDRVDRVGTRTLVYATELALQTGACLAPTLVVNISAIIRGQNSIELYLRPEIRIEPPDGYQLRDSRTVDVTDAPAAVGTPAAITAVSLPAQPVGQKYASENRPALTFLIRDSLGRPVPHAYVRTVIRSPRRPTEIASNNLSSNNFLLSCSNAVGLVAIGSDTMEPYISETGELATFVLSLIDVPASRRPPPAYATVVKVNDLRLVDAVPVIEYQYSPPVAFGRNFHYFLAADEASLRSLDGNQQNLTRTFDGFVGVRSGTKDAVPVCRFFSDGGGGRPLTHWYTADAAECAAKRADSQWIYEGIPFWTFAAINGGYCASGTRAVRRYVYSDPANVAAFAARYSALSSTLRYLVDNFGSATGGAWRDDGVAFCALD